MLEPLSATHKAFRDTTISRSHKEWFDIVARQWGIPHLKAVKEEQWRQAVRSNAMGPRGSIGAAHEFLYYVFQHLNVPVSVTVSGSNPTRLTATNGTFQQNHVNGLVRNSDGTYWKIVGPDDIGAGSYVELSSTSNAPYYTGASFTDSASLSVDILPFVTWESPGVLHVDIWNSSIPFSPATYLQPDADDRPVGQPFGGQIQENEFEPGDPLGAGPHPIYLSNGGVFDEIEEALDTLLVAGVRCVIRRRVDILE